MARWLGRVVLAREHPTRVTKVGSGRSEGGYQGLILGLEALFDGRRNPLGSAALTFAFPMSPFVPHRALARRAGRAVRVAKGACFQIFEIRGDSCRWAARPSTGAGRRGGP